MKAGLLGAIGGLGNAMQTLGSSIIERREKALAEAKAMAKYERERADKKVEKEEDYTRTLARDDALATRRSADAIALEGVRQEGKAADREFRVEDREDRQEFASAQSAASRAAATERTLLAGRLAEERRAANSVDRVAIVKLQDKLKGPGIRGVTYGAPDSRGMSRVYAISKDGKLIDMKQSLRRPAAKADDNTDAPL